MRSEPGCGAAESSARSFDVEKLSKTSPSCGNSADAEPGEPTAATRGLPAANWREVFEQFANNDPELDAESHTRKPCVYRFNGSAAYALVEMRGEISPGSIGMPFLARYLARAPAMALNV